MWKENFTGRERGKENRQPARIKQISAHLIWGIGKAGEGSQKFAMATKAVIESAIIHLVSDGNIPRGAWVAGKFRPDSGLHGEVRRLQVEFQSGRSGPGHLQAGQAGMFENQVGAAHGLGQTGQMGQVADNQNAAVARFLLQ